MVIVHSPCGPEEAGASVLEGGQCDFLGATGRAGYVMPSEQAKRRLAWEDGGRQPQTPEQVAELFREVGLPCPSAVAETFARFGGGRFCHTRAIDSEHYQNDRFKTKYRIVYASEALRTVKGMMKRHPDSFAEYDDPDRFRIEFVECDRCNEAFTLDGHGQVYDAGVRIAGSLDAWLESLSRT